MSSLNISWSNSVFIINTCTMYSLIAPIFMDFIVESIDKTNIHQSQIYMYIKIKCSSMFAVCISIHNQMLLRWWKPWKYFLDQPFLILASCTASFMTSIFFCGTSPVSRNFRRSSTCCFRWSPNTCVGISSQNKVYKSYTVSNYL